MGSVVSGVLPSGNPGEGISSTSTPLGVYPSEEHVEGRSKWETMKSSETNLMIVRWTTLDGKIETADASVPKAGD